jgi:hypothetical protein
LAGDVPLAHTQINTLQVEDLVYNLRGQLLWMALRDRILADQIIDTFFLKCFLPTIVR